MRPSKVIHGSRQTGARITSYNVCYTKLLRALGHPAGDELLVHAAERLRSSLRKADVVARLGGDEFTVLVPDVREPGDAAIIAKQLIDVLSQPFTISGTEIFVAASAGTSRSIGSALGSASIPDRSSAASERLSASRITSYNVCYTKLLRVFSGTRSTKKR